jgi:DNA ligase-1
MDSPEQRELRNMELQDGQTVEVMGSGAKPYMLKNVGGAFSCTCPAWRNQGAPVDRRTCKHLRALRGDAAEAARIGTEATPEVRTIVEAAAHAKAVPPPLLLAHPWTADVNPTGWWMSEKLDGVRAYWTGEAFLSRLGNEYFAPSWFTAALPRTPLDGELWMGRKRFQPCVSAVRSRDAGEAWRAIQYVVFDAPAIAGPFEHRFDECRHRLEGAAPHLRVIDMVRCFDVDHLRRELARIEGLGGEGVMLRAAGSKYEVGRSSTLLKVKTFHDAEARVVAYVPGRGRHKGRVGALIVELEDGTQFNIGTGLSDAERSAPPRVGALVTFRYQELTDGGVPRFPAYVRERADAA